MLSGYIPHEALRALLEFEALKHEIPIRYQTEDLREFQPEPFCPQVEIIAHSAEASAGFELRVGEDKFLVEGDVYFPEGEMILAHDQPLAVLKDRYLFLVFDPGLISGNGHQDLGRLLNTLWGPVFDTALPKLVQSIRNYTWPEASQYARYRVGADQTRIERAEKDVSENEELIQDKIAELLELYRKNDELRQMIAWHQEHTRTQRLKKFVAEYKNLMNLVPHALEKISFTEHKLDAFTQEISLSHRGINYDLGQFQITVRFRDQDLRIYMYRGPAPKDYPHPHVSSDGIPCLGNLAPGVTKLLAEGDYVSLVTVMIEFLKSYNPNNPYLKIDYWDPDFDADEDQREHFEECYESATAQECVRCGDSDCRYNEDAQSRCFEDSSLSECIGCNVSHCRFQQQAVEECRVEHSPWQCVECDQENCPFAGDEAECHESVTREDCVNCPVENCHHRREEEES